MIENYISAVKKLTFNASISRNRECAIIILLYVRQAGSCSYFWLWGGRGYRVRSNFFLRMRTTLPRTTCSFSYTCIFTTFILCMCVRTCGLNLAVCCGSWNTRRRWKLSKNSFQVNNPWLTLAVHHTAAGISSIRTKYLCWLTCWLSFKSPPWISLILISPLIIK